MMTYTDLIKLDTYEERLNYLLLDAKPSELTFGVLRHLNQKFYRSTAWRRIRDEIIARDFGFDLGIPGRLIFGKVLVHHINPIQPKDLYYNVEFALDPENLITVSDETHRAIHFGSEPASVYSITERRKGDTKLW